ncbi:MAG: hypothetical protein KTR29_12100 [Rhodothermaceae bacterium]|nr:hypothetical protein [Rhodothermaceae bacterium]
MQQETVNIISEWIAVTLLNGVWGGLLLVVLLWLGVKCISHVRPINASTRYVIWVSGLVLCIALIGWQGVRSMPESFFQPAVAESQQEEPVLAMVVTPSSDELESANNEAVVIANPDANSNKAVAVDANAMVAEDVDANAVVAMDIDTNDVVALDANMLAEPVILPEEEATSWGIFERLPEAVYSYSISTPPPFVLTIISVIWGVVCSLLLLRLLYSGVLVFRIKRKAASPTPLIKHVLSHWLGAIKGARSVEAGVSNSIKSAVAVGYMHPMILLPEPMVAVLDSSEVEQVVLHELAHIRRLDDWTILLQQVARALLFFHPAIWILSRLMNQDREIACDDWVVSLSKQPKKYASCLAKIASIPMAGYSPIAVAPATSSKKQLFIRVRSILNRKLSDSYKISSKVYGIMVLVALGLFASITYVAPLIAFAENSPVLHELVQDDSPSVPLADQSVIQPDEAPVVTQNEGISNGAEELEPAPSDVATEIPSETGPLVDVQTVAPASLQLEIAAQSELAPAIVNGSGPEIVGDVLVTPQAIEEPESTNSTNEGPHLSEKSMILWLNAVSRISSPGEKKSLLIKASHQLPASEDVHLAFISAALTVSMPSGRLESLLNLLIRSDLSTEAALRYLEAVRSLPTSKDRYGLLITFLSEKERFLMRDERVRQALKSTIQSIQQNSYYQTALDTYLFRERELKEVDNLNESVLETLHRVEQVLNEGQKNDNL